MSTYNELCQAMATRKTIRLACQNEKSVTGKVQNIGYDGTPNFYIVKILTDNGKIETRTIKTILENCFDN